MAIKKYQINQKQSDGSLLALHPETDADIVSYDPSSSQLTKTNVQEALDELDAKVEGLDTGVTGVKGNAETTYRTGNVNITPANIGAEAAFTDGSATIASVSSDVVTIKGGIKQSSGAITNKTTTEAADIVLAKIAKTGSYNDLSNKPTIPTVNNGTLTIKFDSTTKTFTANQSGNVEVDLGTIIHSHQSLTALQPKAISLTGITATTVEGALTEINDLAKGKNKSYVTNTTQMSALNTQNDSVEVTSFKDSTGATINLSNFKVGDNVFITNTDVPDRWVSAVTTTKLTLNKLETQKVTVPTKTSELTNDSNFVSDANYKHITVTSTSVSDGTNTFNKYVLTKAAIDNLISYQAPITSSAKLSADLIQDGTTNKVVTSTEKTTWSGKQNAITSTNKLDASLIGDDATHRFVSDTEKSTWNGKQDALTTAQLNAANSGITSTKVSTYDGYATTIAGKYVKPSTGIPSSDLANSGVTAGTYSCVQVNAKGLVTTGAQIVEVGTVKDAGPSTSLATGGIFFKLIA